MRFSDVSRVTSPPSRAMVSPSSAASSSSRSSTTRSITFCSSASRADRLDASRTVSSAHSTLRPRSSAIPWRYATASLMTLRSIAVPGFGAGSSPVASPSPLPSSAGGSGSVGVGAWGIGRGLPPPMLTGVDEPMLVAGAIAAMWARIHDVGAGARCPRAVGRDVGCHRHRRGQQHLDHVAHGLVEPAGSIETQHDEIDIGVGRILEGADEIVGRGRADGTVYFEHPDLRGGGLLGGEDPEERSAAEAQEIRARGIGAPSPGAPTNSGPERAGCPLAMQAILTQFPGGTVSSAGERALRRRAPAGRAPRATPG